MSPRPTKHARMRSFEFDPSRGLSDEELQGLIAIGYDPNKRSDLSYGQGIPSINRPPSGPTNPLDDSDIEALTAGVDRTLGSPDPSVSQQRPYIGDTGVDMEITPADVVNYKGPAIPPDEEPPAAPEEATQPLPQHDMEPSYNWEDELINSKPQPLTGRENAMVGLLSAFAGPEAGLHMRQQQLNARQQAEQNAIMRARIGQNHDPAKLALQQQQLLARIQGQQGVADRFDRGQDLREEKYATQKEQYGQTRDFQERKMAQQGNQFGQNLEQRQSEQAQRASEGAANRENSQILKDKGIAAAEAARNAAPELARLKRQQDPVLRDKARMSYEDLNQPLRKANEAWEYLVKNNPKALENFVQFGSQGIFGQATKLASSDKDKAAISALEELLVTRGFGTGGKTFSPTERDAIENYQGAPIGKGFSPFQSTSVLHRYLGALNDARKVRKRSLDLEFPGLFTGSVP